MKVMKQRINSARLFRWFTVCQAILALNYFCVGLHPFWLAPVESCKVHVGGGIVLFVCHHTLICHYCQEIQFRLKGAYLNPVNQIKANLFLLPLIGSHVPAQASHWRSRVRCPFDIPVFPHVFSLSFRGSVVPLIFSEMKGRAFISAHSHLFLSSSRPHLFSSNSPYFIYSPEPLVSQCISSDASQSVRRSLWNPTNKSFR